MTTVATVEKSPPHVVCVPFPAQGHINPMLHVAKLLHSRGFHVTFINTDYNHNRMLKSWGASGGSSIPPGFDFESFPDGLPLSDNVDTTQDIPSLCDSIAKNCLAPFRDLVHRLNENDVVSPRVSCILSDAAMAFTLDVAKELGVPDALFLTPSACANLGFLSYHVLVKRGLVPLKNSSYLTNGYLDTVVDIPGLNKNMCLKHLPTFVRTTDPNDVVFNFCVNELARIPEGSTLIMNTFDSLEKEALASLSPLCPNLLTVGPLINLLDQVKEEKLNNIDANLWIEHPESLQWLDSQEDNSVLYVNFGSITVITPDQLAEFAWGLAKSEKPFLWIIRNDLVFGNSEGADLSVPSEFIKETRGRGLVAGWCNQEQVLKHPSIGGFLSHMGWNSTLESISNGVPMICWPFFADQQTNCFYACREWGIGIEIDSEVKREEVEKLVREVMGGEKGKEMKRKTMEWKVKAEEATNSDGSSFQNLEKLIEILLQK
uniref:UDP-glycosyltransferase 1 n=1 Tax=Linum usitatissimum TaxID=4006 RepID=I2BHA8_LINUS|nr:UDP-glycosyltransferase 1 [Linum usitatissimum]